MTNKDVSDFQIVSWKDVRDDVKKVNPELTAIIDQINPGKDYPLVKASYRFGDLIIKDGCLQLPTKNGLLSSIDDPNIDKKISKSLTYSSIPLGLSLNKSSEIFIYGSNRIIPLNFFDPGKMFGTFETTNSIFDITDHPTWNVAAGARSIFMLPKMTKASGFKRLRNAFNIPPSMRLASLHDHWQIFRHIANQQGKEQLWQSTIIFFTDTWFKRKNDLAWEAFNSYLFKQAWLQSSLSIARFEFGIFWQNFVKAIAHRNLRPTTYLSDTIKHLLAIATNVVPAFVPADNSQLAAPTTFLQDAIVYVYQLDNYLPAIMHPYLLNNSNKQVYYSLNMPTILEGTPEGKKTLTIMLDLKDIKLMLETFMREITINDQKLIKNVKFSYFHAEEDKHGEIHSSKLILDGDERFSSKVTNFPDREFCWTSAFWQGCIKISREN